MNIKELKELIKDLPDETRIMFERIEDKYIDGMNKNYVFNGETYHEDYAGWTTYDMPCDSCQYRNSLSEEQIKHICKNCDNKNQYIEVSRGFIYDGELFLDGHW